jgi:hypothetical protein
METSDDPLHRVCIVDSDGRVLRSYGGSKGSSNGQLNVPDRIVVNGFIFVVDFNNHRVLMLNSTLNYVRGVVSGLGGGFKECVSMNTAVDYTWQTTSLKMLIASQVMLKCSTFINRASLQITVA